MPARANDAGRADGAFGAGAGAGALAPPALVILAAGESRRLGACKALVRLRAEPPATPLELLLEAGAALGDPRPLVVAGAHHAAIAAAAAELARASVACEVAYNARWAEGRAGSVLLARALRPGRDFCLAPIDVPLVPSAVFAALRDAWAAAGAPELGWLAPLAVREETEEAKEKDKDDKRKKEEEDEAPSTPTARLGHPVMVGRELLSRWAPRTLDEPLRTLRDLAAKRWTVPVASAAVLDDLDTPDDLEELRSRLRGR